MSGSTRARIVVSGIMFLNPVAGVVYQVLHYLLGLRALGHDVYYVEDTNWWTFDPRTGEVSADPTPVVSLLKPIFDRHGLGDRWAYRRAKAVDEPRGCWGMNETTVVDLYRDCDAWINVTGSQTVWDDVARCRHRVLVESDPVSAQIEVANGHQPTIDHLDAHHTHFTFGETMVHGGSPIPLGAYNWQPTRQPVAMELWAPAGEQSPKPEHSRFTTVTSWHDERKDRIFEGITYRWTKDDGFLRILDLPRSHPDRFELAVTSDVGSDRQRLEGAGWRLRDALALSADCDHYRRYIQDSYGEFTVAREQYTKPVTGWFSDRSATYLAAGRPVITQETGFSRVLPTGSGLYPWRTMDDIAAAVDHIDADPGGARRAAREIAREYFAADRVVGSLLERAGL